LPLIGLIPDHRIVQQLFTNALGNLLGVDIVTPHLFAVLIVMGKLTIALLQSPLSLEVRFADDQQPPMGPGTAPRTNTHSLPPRCAPI
jgi:hypothetical protein